MGLWSRWTANRYMIGDRVRVVGRPWTGFTGTVVGKRRVPWLLFMEVNLVKRDKDNSSYQQLVRTISGDGLLKMGDSDLEPLVE